jgi:hypothetical protein
MPLLSYSPTSFVYWIHRPPTQQCPIHARGQILPIYWEAFGCTEPEFIHPQFCSVAALWQTSSPVCHHDLPSFSSLGNSRNTPLVYRAHTQEATIRESVEYIEDEGAEVVAIDQSNDPRLEVSARAPEWWVSHLPLFFDPPSAIT